MRTVTYRLVLPEPCSLTLLTSGQIVNGLCVKSLARSRTKTMGPGLSNNDSAQCP